MPKINFVNYSAREVDRREILQRDKWMKLKEIKKHYSEAER
jgi:hypothetical protein